MARKGRPSLKNAQFIAENVSKMTLEQIADQTQLSPHVVEKLADVYGHQPEKNIYWKTYLHHHIVWKQLKKEFSSDELEIFEDKFCALITQFKEDVTPTEETQIFQLIKIDILMSRNLASKQKMQAHIGLLEKVVQGVVDKYAGNFSDIEKEDRNYLDEVNRQIVGSRQAEQTTSKEYLELQTQYNRILELLKAARNQRKDILENSKFAFTDLVKSLMDRDKAEIEGRQLELFKLASVKETKRLSKPHKYISGEVDLPILSAETLDAYDGMDKEELATAISTTDNEKLENKKESNHE